MKYLELANGAFTEEHYEKSLKENFPYVGYSVEENKVLYSEIIKDYVDLGLPSGTMWARCNVNAGDPYDFGDQFYFGSIDSNSTEYNVPGIGCIDFYPDNFKSDGEFLIEQYYDAAYFHSNGKFRIPTANDFRELLENTYSIFHFENDNGEALEFEAYWNPNANADSLGHQLPEEVGQFYYAYQLKYVKLISLNNKRYIIFPANDDEFSYHVYHSSTTEQSGYCWSLYADYRGLLILNGGPGSGRVLRSVRGVLVKRNKIDSSSYNKIDLGLRTDDGKIIYFADRNLGANSPEEVGNYYQWGTTEGAPIRYDYIKDPSTNRNYLQWGLNYKHYNYIHSSSFWNIYATEWEMTKYNEDSELVLENKDDAAHIKLGGKWQIPGYNELDPLMNPDLFDHEYVNSNTETGEFDGVRVISKIPGFEGNSIYLPATGFVDASGKGYTVDEIKYIGSYWSKTMYYGSVDTIELGCDYISWGASDAINGLPIRPVWIE